MHKAVLRFRDQEVARVTGIDFTPVVVRKGVWSFDKNRFIVPDIRAVNQYSAKCLNGWLANDRSIWNLDPEIRYIAPESFYEQLVENLGARICWDSPFDFAACPGVPVISTAPMDIVLRALNITPPDLTFKKAPINVKRFRVPDCDLYQSVYYPDRELGVYRASITKDLLIAEFAGSCTQDDMGVICRSFGLDRDAPKLLDQSGQRYGKIAAIDDTARKHLIGRLTTEFNIFSLGRFATWRNILLDDVVNDALIIKKLLKATAYERKLHLHQ